MAALRAKGSSSVCGGANASQSNTKGAEEQQQEGSGSRRSSPCKKMSKRWDLRGEDERTQTQLRVEVSKATAQFVRHNHKNGCKIRLTRRRQKKVCLSGRRRAFEEAASKCRFDQGAAGSGKWTGESSSRQHWSSGWWRGSWNCGEGWNSWNDPPHNSPSLPTGYRSMKKMTGLPGKKKAKRHGG